MIPKIPNWYGYIPIFLSLTRNRPCQKNISKYECNKKIKINSIFYICSVCLSQHGMNYIPDLRRNMFYN